MLTARVTCDESYFDELRAREFSRLAWYFRHKHKGVTRKGAVHRPCSR